MTDDLIRQIHRSGWTGVLVTTGGGATAISRLLSVPGGSNSVLAAAVPYSSAALADWLGRRPDSFCAEETALAMAAVAYQQAQKLAKVEGRAEPRFGLSCTASLASDRPKRGAHRAFVALHSERFTRSARLHLEKEARDRFAEEQLVSELILKLLAEICGTPTRLSLELRTGDQFLDRRVDADPLLVELIESRQPVVWSLPDGSLRVSLPPLWQETKANPQSNLPSRGVLCGSFHPLHEGHAELRRVASRKLNGGPVYYELSLKNVDKPPLDYLTIESRRRQFVHEPLALTCAPTFAAKSAALPQTTFVVGADTAQRIVDPRYYDGSAAERDQALATIRHHGCHFLVAGRRCDTAGFLSLREIPVPANFADLFDSIPENEFRADVSSTELRQQQSSLE